LTRRFPGSRGPKVGLRLQLGLVSGSYCWSRCPTVWRASLRLQLGLVPGSYCWSQCPTVWRASLRIQQGFLISESNNFNEHSTHAPRASCAGEAPHMRVDRGAVPHHLYHQGGLLLLLLSPHPVNYRLRHLIIVPHRELDPLIPHHHRAPRTEGHPHVDEFCVRGFGERRRLSAEQPNLCARRSARSWYPVSVPASYARAPSPRWNARAPGSSALSGFWNPGRTRRKRG
jgi:hypothetical protein